MSDRKRVKKSSAPRLHSETGTKGGGVREGSTDSPGATRADDQGHGTPPPAEGRADHVHEPVPHAPYIVYVPVQRQRFYTCATCGCALFVIPTPEEADEFDRVLESQLEERG